MRRDTRAHDALLSTLLLGLAGAATAGCIIEQPAPSEVVSYGAPYEPPQPGTWDDPTGQELTNFPAAQNCAGCHDTIYKEWSWSMHAHSLKSAVSIAQIKQAYDAEYYDEGDPDPQQLCTNCHSPLAALYTGQATLPFDKEPFSKQALMEGIGCATCHTYTGDPIQGNAGLSFIQDDFDTSGTFYGPITNPMPNDFHASDTTPLMLNNNADALCQNCHEVKLDRNNDGLIEPGVDLILQQTDTEYRDYLARGGQRSCISCHMPDRQGPAADGVAGAPTRKLHSHTFVGVDYPIDIIAEQGDDPQQEMREDLLQDAAQIDIKNIDYSGQNLTFDVSIQNTNTGHNLPTGFAFMRQMWLEVKVVNDQDQPLFESGVLDDPTLDLCDANTLFEPSNVVTHLAGCEDFIADEQLVNFQTKLVNVVEPGVDQKGNPIAVASDDPADPGIEVWLQFLEGGAVLRQRPFDGQELASIRPEETRVFGYKAPIQLNGQGKIKVRLLFRNFPPYMFRTLDAGQDPSEIPLSSLIDDIQIVEMESAEALIQ